jgi:Cu-processing system permease protein
MTSIWLTATSSQHWENTMIDLTIVRAVARKELRDALQNRWFAAFTMAFVGLALALTSLGQPGSIQLQAASYSRTAASLINLVLLFVPLIGLTLGATNLVGDKETGALTYLLSQPVNRVEVLLGKYAGICGALLATLTLGFGVAGIVLALQGTARDAGEFVFTVVLAFLLALAMLSIGFLLSTLAQTTATALGAALFAWLLLVFIGDLGIMGTAVATRMPVESLFFLTILNPLQLYRIASIQTIQAHLEVLGPAGLYATNELGNLLMPVLLAGMSVWIISPLVLATALFSRLEKFTVKVSKKGKQER